MRLDKKKWEKVEFGQCVEHIEETETNPKIRNASRYVSVEHIETGELKIRNWTEKIMPTFFRKFKSGQVLFGKRRAYQRKVAVADFNGICSPHIWALQSKNNLLQKFLPFVMMTEKFYKYVNANSAGTMSPYLKWPQLSRYSFLLPPIEDQMKISDLMYFVGMCIEQTEQQEKSIKRLWKRMINELVSDTPRFGDLLEGRRLIKVNFCDVTEKMMRKIDPVSYGVERIVAGENLESEDFKIRTWQSVGKDYLGPAFHILFKEGDILYGSRRTYLKKVALADFEGVCANTTYVIRADEEVLLQNLLKHIMLSEKFTQYSVGVSKGSTNPYINWKDLNNFSFQLPDLQLQQEIASVLDSLIDLMEQCKSQLNNLKNLKIKLLNEILG